MGNIKEKLANAKTLEEVAPHYKHIQDTRPDSEVQITNKLTHLISDLNSSRIMKNAEVNVGSFDWSGYVFVCVQGFPALKNEFQVLGIPGQKIYFAAYLFSEEADRLSDQEKQKLVFETTFKKEAERLHKILSSIPEDKNIVFIYHSAGNFILSMYFFYFGFKWLKDRIKGMIDIAGAPLRYYTSARMLSPVIIETDVAEMIKNGDRVHQFFIKSMSSLGFDLGFNKYNTLAFLHFMKSPNYQELFETTWHHPEVFKLMIHGRNDTIFQDRLLNEKALYYSYRKQLNPEYEAKLVEKYKKLYKPNYQLLKIQDRFILSIPRGQHSVHTQPRNQPLIRAAVQQYLTLIHE